MTDSAAFDLVLSNAKRLHEDAHLLVKEQRAKSATILAVFALEELGKALIFRWGVRNLASKRTHPTHLEKQTATFALLAAHQMLTKDAAEFRARLDEGRMNFIELGGHSEQFAWARSGFYDTLRMIATYADPEPIWPREITDQLDEKTPREFCGWFDEAIAATEHELAMKLASAIYENGLGRL
jgi:AbiV family abortive infection protein